MIRRVAILVFLLFFASGTIAAMAAGGPATGKKSYFQEYYNWFGTWDKLCLNKSDRFCRACEKKCCDNCNMNCGGTCCSNCGKK